jgi:hypothetical protein
MLCVLRGQKAEHAFIAWYRESDAERTAGMKASVARLEAEIRRETEQIAVLLRQWSLLSVKKRERTGRRQQALRQREAKLRREQALLKAVLSPETAQKLFARSLAVPRVQTIHVRRPMVWIVYTEPLFSYDMDKRQWHCLGRYRIIIDLELPNPNKIQWENMTFGPRGDAHGRSTTYVAPQILSPGTVGCLGGADAPMRSAYLGRAYDNLVSIAVRLAECSTTSVISLWPVVSLEEVPQWYRETALKW